MRRRRAFLVEVERRLFRIQEEIQIDKETPDMQTLRKKWITKLDNLFELATSIANPDKDSDKLKSINLRERQMWAQIATRIGEVMSNLSKGYDGRQFNEDLTKLEKLVDDIGKFQTESAGAEIKIQDAKSEDKNSGTNNFQ